ncbi:MAG TPA: adenosylmethionine--8-amino-7-oxononanoate transaminase [Kofleriaceae bacterium]|nr:adenosylmethionine--8-amino-7-oxononanoate transaminase [Kofleriaceae bacterium]
MTSIAARDKAVVWHPFTQMSEWAAAETLVIERAQGCYLYDTDGRRYFDAVSSLWVNVHGHNHPAINQAIIDQLGRVAHTTLLGLASPPSVELAERLVALAPDPLTRVFYSDNGSTAVEIALKQAFQYWQHKGRPGKQRFIYLDQAYHGDTLGAVAVGGMALFHELFGPLLPGGGLTHLRAPSPQHGATDQERAERALAGLRQILAERAKDCAALIIEPLIQGAAGMLVQPPGYLREVAALCRRHEVLLIVDEVATGFGRTGTMFACEQEDVRPDFLCVAKGLTGGYLPLAATLTTDEIYSAFLAPRTDYKAFFHGHTYTGNPLACAAALASLELFETDQVLAQVGQSALLLTDLSSSRLAALPEVHEIRQRGLMMGVELRRADGTGFDPALAVGARVCAAMREHGVIDRPLGDVLVFMPPLCATRADLELMVAAAANAIAQVCR